MRLALKTRVRPSACGRAFRAASELAAALRRG